MRPLVDDFVRRGYFGIILTGGEPTLHPDLPAITRYARDQGLHVRMITNGSRLADPRFAHDMADAGLQLVHVSIYSVVPEVEARLRGVDGTLPDAFAALDAAGAAGIDVNINCVINKLNADHLDHNVRYITRHHGHVRHFVWNNLDPSMGRAEVNQDQFTPRLADFELSLERAMRHLHKSGRTFRVEKVPLCYMGSFPWASTETRKIVKGEERIVHFLDAKQTVRQTEWDHIYTDECRACTLRSICGGLFDRGDAYDPAELAPVFVNRDEIVRTIIEDPSDPSYVLRELDAWKANFARRCEPREPNLQLALARTVDSMREPDLPAVGRVTDKGRRLYEAKRRREATLASRTDVAQERDTDP